MLKSINFLKYVNKYADKVYLEPQVLWLDKKELSH